MPFWQDSLTGCFLREIEGPAAWDGRRAGRHFSFLHAPQMILFDFVIVFHPRAVANQILPALETDGRMVYNADK